MATRSRIGIYNADGTITGIYCHWDGYPENNGKILVDHYTSITKIRKLLKLGNLSSLGPEIGSKHGFNDRTDDECTFYRRDRGDKIGWRHTEYKDFAEWLGDREDYNYLFRDGAWHCYDYEKVPVVLDFSPEEELA